MERLADFTDATLRHQRVVDATRFVGCLACCEGDYFGAAAMFDQRWPASRNSGLVRKAAVAAGTLTSGNWTAALAASFELGRDFVEFLRPLTIVGRLSRVRRAPFNVKVRSMTAGLTAAWVGAGRPIPIRSASLETVTLAPRKLATIVPITRELARLQDAAAETHLRDELTAGIVALLDTSFVSLTNGGATDVSPASITYGVTPTASSGSDGEAAAADLAMLIATFVARGGSLATATILLSSANAVGLALMAVDGSPRFPRLTVTGGTLAGLPALASDACGDTIVIVDERAILLADDAGVTFDVATATSLSMLDNPTDGSTTTVSLWQSNSVAVRIERYVNFELARDGAVAVLSDANYLPALGSPIV